MALVGYARVSTGEQSTSAQLAALRAAGCDRIFEEHASGGLRTRPRLEEAVEAIGAGDTLVVVRMDRLARSLMHLLEVIGRLEAKGAHFRSLQDPIDTASPQGRFAMQVLGAAAELERALIRERTRAGLEESRRQGRVPGNPGLARRDPAALDALRRARESAHFEKLTRSAEQWVPEVRRLRPLLTWEAVTRIVNQRLPEGAERWTRDRLVRAARAYVRDGLLPETVLDRAGRAASRDDRLPAVVAAIAGGPCPPTVREICRRLEMARIPTPRGGRRWNPSSVQMLLERARRDGVLEGPESGTACSE